MKNHSENPFSGTGTDTSTLPIDGSEIPLLITAGEFTAPEPESIDPQTIHGLGRAALETAGIVMPEGI